MPETVRGLRFEWEFKDGKARQAVRQFVALGWDQLVGLCRGFVDFVDSEHEVQTKSRRRPAAWWVQLMTESRERFDAAAAVAVSLARAHNWFAVQVAPQLAALVANGGGSLEWVTNELVRASGRWKERHRLLVAAPLYAGAT